jgi:hypothetical protein
LSAGNEPKILRTILNMSVVEMRPAAWPWKVSAPVASRENSHIFMTGTFQAERARHVVFLVGPTGTDCLPKSLSGGVNECPCQLKKFHLRGFR